ncbi:hypothetical protein ACHAWX_003572 [Stephanocyclus meneghinianus]
MLTSSTPSPKATAHANVAARAASPTTTVHAASAVVIKRSSSPDSDESCTPEHSTDTKDSAARSISALEASPVRKKQKMYTPLLPQTASSRSRVYQYGSPRSDEVGVKLNFAQRLMELLEKDDVKPCLHWMEDGRSICIEDPVQFANEIMPKYFSDTKYKSFMVRMKRWGFKTVSKDSQASAKIMECELFRRDQPELCLLMGDERRVDRINVAKAITKTANDKLDVHTREIAAATAPVTSAVVSKPQPAAVEAGGLLCHTSTANQELAMLQYQRNLHNMASYNMLSGRYPVSDRGAFFRDMTTAAATASLRGLPTPSLVASMGGDTLQLFRQDMYGDRGMGAVADLSLLSIEQDIQYCLDTIALHQDRLLMLQSIKEMKLSLAGSRSAGCFGNLLHERCHP